MAAPDAATMRNLQSQGKAMPNASGNPSFPIRNADDLAKAILAVGRVKPATDAARAKVRCYIAARAKALGLSSKIPDTWAADGSLKDDGNSSPDTGSGSDSGADSKSTKTDPDGDGDDDSTPEGDTDHDYWDKDGKQIKALPGKPLPPKGAAARIFAKK
jgi:hypothetical protein